MTSFHRSTVSKAQLDAMVEEATVDCYNEDEQVGGLFNMIEDRLAVPFETLLLGVEVTVASVNMADSGQIVAICSLVTRALARLPSGPSRSANAHVKSYGGAVSPGGTPPWRTSDRSRSGEATTRAISGVSRTSSPAPTSCHPGTMRSALWMSQPNRFSRKS